MCKFPNRLDLHASLIRARRHSNIFLKNNIIYLICLILSQCLVNQVPEEGNEIIIPHSFLPAINPAFTVSNMGHDILSFVALCS